MAGVTAVLLTEAALSGFPLRAETTSRRAARIAWVCWSESGPGQLLSPEFVALVEEILGEEPERADG